MKTSKGTKAVIVVGLVICLWIALFPVQNLVRERSDRKAITEEEVSKQWSGFQRIHGPYIHVVGKVLKNENAVIDGKKVNTTKSFYHERFFSPDELKISGKINPEKRKRGIYEVILYDSDLKISGNFDEFEKKKEQAVTYDWENAEIRFGIRDMRGLNENIIVSINGEKVRLENSSDPHMLKASLSNLTEASKSVKFDFNLKFRGSEKIEFTPTSANTEIALTSAWNSPSFYGSFLPIDHEITSEGFRAKWNVLEMNRNIPPASNNIYSETNKSYQFGVKLIDPNDNYQKNERAVKYGVLIISLTFLGFFFSELILEKSVNIIQYGLVGLALIIFYCLLLSFSEVINFNPAYIVSTVMTIGLLFSFCRGIFTSWKPSAVISSITLISYSFIFVIIQLEDTALLAGSLGLFFILALTMWVSRKVNWETTFRNRKDGLESS